MSHILFIGLLLILFTSPVTAGDDSGNEGHRIEVHIEELRDTTLILGHYFNQRMYVDDTTRINNEGIAVFEGEEPLPGGIYVIYLPSQRYFDVLVDNEQHFSVSVDTNDFVNSMEVEGAPQTRKFNQYQQFISGQQAKAKNLQDELQNAGPDTEEGKEARARLEELDKEVKDHWNQLIEENPGTMLALFLKGIQDIEVPEMEPAEDTENPDSALKAKRYQYYKTHYFDNIDFTDERILRTPFFAKKVENYFTNVLPQIPDTLTEEGINIIESARPSSEVFRFLVQFLFNHANESKIMGMDKMVVELAEKYYLSGEAEWAEEDFIQDLETRVEEIKPTLIGEKAHDLKMQSHTGEHYRLHELSSPATVLVFWETDCGHCKEAIPELHELYSEKLMEKGVKVFAVYTQGDQEEWNQFIDEHELYDFIHVWDPSRQTNFRKHYNINSTPSIFILGEDDEIIGKKIAVQDIPSFIDHYLENGRANMENKKVTEN